MSGNGPNAMHSAEASALGFYYQTFFALLTLLGLNTDDAAVSVETLDDVELKADGQMLLFQLKHSIRSSPQPITLKSRALWNTLRVWIDALPSLTLSETTLHLVAVAGMAADSPLMALTSMTADRSDLVKALVEEAERVRSARATATNKNALPHADRVDGCEAFLALSETQRLNLLRRMLIKQDSPPVGKIEERVTEHLKIVRPEQRPIIAQRLIEWWDRQVVYSLCGKRQRVISRAELQEQLSIIIGDLEHGRLLADFETVSEPDDYQPDGTLALQIRLVDGKNSDLSKAIREEWRAREQRSKWINEKPSMAAVIGDYDLVLEEYWSDRHCQMAEDCVGREENYKKESGLKILRWTHNEAPNVVRPIADGWNAPYYVRGSYQVLAINLKVGWHPDYAERLLGGYK